MILAIAEVNKLVGYQLDKYQLAEWAEDVLKLAPEVEPSRLAFLFDCYKTERLVWDNTKGIQNIFSGIRMIYKVVDSNYPNGVYILRKSMS